MPIRARGAHPPSIGTSIHEAADGKETDAVFHPDQINYPQIQYAEAVAIVEPSRMGACLVAGCPCKDARIVSHRRAAFFSALARRNGETADRVIAPDPAWLLPLVAADPGDATYA
jgi:hypothetical protein